ncbi:hypothetical protein ACJ41O_004026 [Fusarium nematophilum]
MLGAAPSFRLPVFVLFKPRHLSNRFRWIHVDEQQRELLRKATTPVILNLPIWDPPVSYVDQLYRLAFFSSINGLSVSLGDFESSHNAAPKVFLFDKVPVKSAIRLLSSFQEAQPSLYPKTSSPEESDPREPSEFYNIFRRNSNLKIKVLAVLGQLALAPPDKGYLGSPRSWITWMDEIGTSRAISLSSFSRDSQELDSSLFGPAGRALRLHTWNKLVQRYGAQLCQVGILSNLIMVRRKEVIEGGLGQSAPDDFCPLLGLPFLAARDVERFTASGRFERAEAHGNLTWFQEMESQFHPTGLACLSIALADACAAMGDYRKAEKYLAYGSGLHSLTGHFKVVMSLRQSLARRRLDKLSLRDAGPKAILITALQNMEAAEEDSVKLAVLEEVTVALSHLRRLGFSREIQRSRLLQHAMRIFSSDPRWSSDWRFQTLTEFHGADPDAETDGAAQQRLFQPLQLRISVGLDFEGELQEWFNSILRKGIRYMSDGSHQEAWFVDESALATFYGENAEIVHQLVAKVAPTPILGAEIACKLIEQSCQRIFLMLLLLGQGALVELFLLHPGLHDSCLPFRERPEDFPLDDELWRSFDKLQGTFCVPETWYTNEGHYFAISPGEIIPISERCYVGEGRSAVVERIQFCARNDPSKEQGQGDHEKLAESGKSMDQHIDDLDILTCNLYTRSKRVRFRLLQVIFVVWNLHLTLRELRVVAANEDRTSLYISQLSPLIGDYESTLTRLKELLDEYGDSRGLTPEQDRQWTERMSAMKSELVGDQTSLEAFLDTVKADQSDPRDQTYRHSFSVFEDDVGTLLMYLKDQADQTRRTKRARQWQAKKDRESQARKIRVASVLDGSQKGKVYALKTFNTARAEMFFEAEIARYEALGSLRYPLLGLIQFHGGFSCLQTFGIFLEFADGGNLHDYWESTPAPTSELDVHRFWYAFSKVAEAVSLLHQLSSQNGDNKSHSSRWSLDIKPSNILVVSGSTGEPYDIQLKLANFGVCLDFVEESETHGWGSQEVLTYGK